MRLYLEDIQVGQRFETGSYVVDEEEIVAFAKQYDPQPFHRDPAAAKHTFFGELVASGWHTAAITMRLVVESGPKLAAGIVGRGGSLEWRKPTRPGDELRVVCEVTEVRESRSNPTQGTVSFTNQTINQHGDVVQIMKSALIVPRRLG
jgi:acyl dehydratase